jgi:hypothetical protein
MQVRWILWISLVTAVPKPWQRELGDEGDTACSTSSMFAEATCSCRVAVAAAAGIAVTATMAINAEAA